MHRVTGIFNRVILAIFAMSLAALVAAKSELAPASVGEVTMVVGKAIIATAAGSSVPARVGMAIHVGDTIETAGSGHVYVRFVDEAMMSVRPMSTLQVVRYDYNPQNPQDSAIKLKLVEGIAREISGQGAKNARQNFRMDTPIAAIGVRGTDFAVSVNNQSLRAIVNEGAIVAAPYSSQCSAAALGPCSQNALVLDGLSHQILEMNASTAGTSSALLPASTAQAQALVAEASAKADNANKSTKAADAKDFYTDTVTARAVNTTLANSETVKPGPVVPPPPLDIVVPVVPEFTPTAAQTVAALTTNSQLVWGRWTEGNLDNERITVKVDVAYQNGRQAAGNDNSNKYGLFRAESAGQTLQPGLPVLAFNLTKAQANFTSGGKVELMQVSGGQLSLDFNEAMFSTSLQLNHAATGKITFTDSGHIFSGGYFHNYGDTQSTVGAVSLDGKEAGYSFQKTLTNGSVDGLTLWSQKP